MMTIYYENWTTTQMDAIIEVILHGLLCIIFVILMVIYFCVFECKKELCCFKDKSNDFRLKKDELYRNIPKIYKYLLFTSLIISGINIFGNLWISNLSVIMFGIRNNKGCFYRTLLGISFFLQRILTYFFFLDRLRYTFRGSIFAIKPRIYYISIGIAITLFIATYGALIVMTYVHPDVSFLCVTSSDIVIIIIAYLGIDLCITILLTIIFIKKLNGLIRLTNMVDNNTDNIAPDVHKIQRQIKLRLIVTKLTILCLVAVISTLVFSVIFGNILTLYTYQTYALDLIINNICMMLSFAVLAHSYKKICCICVTIHNKCTKKGKIATKLEVQLGSYVKHDLTRIRTKTHSVISVNTIAPSVSNRMNSVASNSPKSPTSVLSTVETP